MIQMKLVTPADTSAEKKGKKKSQQLPNLHKVVSFIVVKRSILRLSRIWNSAELHTDRVDRRRDGTTASARKIFVTWRSC
jgi:hypothetical protein